MTNQRKKKNKKTKGEKMSKIYTPDHVMDLICELNLSKRAFCKRVNLNRGDFSRFMNGKKYLSDRVSFNIACLEAERANKKAERLSIWQKITRMLGV